MKTKIIVVIIVISVLYGWLEYTSIGRITGLYFFSAFKAPLSIKIDCIKTSNEKVKDKFTLPLNFDENSKNALREYWHFSYYRACLFNNEYDFYGNVIKKSIIENGNYTNYFGGISFSVPENSIILEDNSTNPDVEDRLLFSVIKSGNEEINVFVYRNFDNVDSFETLKQLSVVKDSLTNLNGIKIVELKQDNNISGLAVFTNKKYVVEIFGEKTLLEKIKNSITFLEY